MSWPHHKKCPVASRAFSYKAASSKTVVTNREVLRIAAEIRRRIERLAVDRAVVVLARERWVPDRRRERVVLEFAVARQHFGAGIEPGARRDVDAGVRPLLVGPVRTLASVIGAAVLVVFWGLDWALAEVAPTATRAAAASNTTSLLAAGNFGVIASSSLSAPLGRRIAKSDWRHCSRGRVCRH